MVINTGVAGKEFTVSELNHILEDVGFVRWSWDYSHISYDYKLVENSTKNTYYLRVQANLVQGHTEDDEAVVKVEEPFIGKHLFPHGIDYDAAIPPGIMNTAKDKLAAFKAKL